MCLVSWLDLLCWLFRPIDGIIGSFLFVSVCVCCIFLWCCLSPVYQGLSCYVRRLLFGCASGLPPDDLARIAFGGIKVVKQVLYKHI